MLLIQSDMFKALWFMIHPVVVFTRGPVLSNSAFCQASGFFISIGIEASGTRPYVMIWPSFGETMLTVVDFAILMIAVHTALYIFKPSQGLGEGGLYPYRHFAYVLWVIFPALMSSLAFLNPDNAYVTQETYCYLPIRPFWYGLALSWIPRYIIFITITVVYFSIYGYVKYKFSELGSDVGDTSRKRASAIDDPTLQSADLTAPNRVHRPDRPEVPSMPKLARHGLIPHSDTASTISPTSRKQSVISNGSPRARSNSRGYSWDTYTLANLDTTLFDPAKEPQSPLPPELHYDASRSSPSTLDTDLLPDSTTSVTSTMHVFRGFKFRRPSSAATPLEDQPHFDLSLSLVDSRGRNIATEELRKTRTAIRRQLRFLFIYPLVYMLMWVIPFISHCMQYTDYYVSHMPFVLSCLVTIIIALQCAVDCWLFSTREKPWRYIPGSKGTFVNSFLFWRHNALDEARGTSSSVPVARAGPGKSRAEMVAEARIAYKRRAEELAHSATLFAEREGREQLAFAAGAGGRRGRDKSWWEEEGRMRRDSVFLEQQQQQQGAIPTLGGSAGDEQAGMSVVHEEKLSEAATQHEHAPPPATEQEEEEDEVYEPEVWRQPDITNVTTERERARRKESAP